MSSQKQRKATEDGRSVMDKIRTSLFTGTTAKLFEDDYFIFELIKLLYDDSLDVHTKVEILTIIEQHACGALPTNSIDQVVTALVAIFQGLVTSSSSFAIATQLLITVTTVFVSNEELMHSELCTNFVNQLTALVTKINNVSTRRLRACCCQCLAQLVMWKPGLLWRWRDVLAKLMKDEKTDICQDYMHLLISIISNPDPMEISEQTRVGEQMDKKLAAMTGTPREGKDILPAVSHIMDNMLLLTPPGLTTVTCSIAKIIKTVQDIPPTIFKPLMLQFLSSMDPMIIYLMLHIQKEFRGSILSTSEERLVLKRALECVNLPTIGPYTRLIICQLILSYLQDEQTKSVADVMMRDMLPVVFDPLDLHTCKLGLISHCVSPEYQDLSRDFHYLTQLAETTGGARVSRALFHILYLHVTGRNSETVHNHILRITKKLFQNFPHRIPMIVDFLRAVKSHQPHSELHKEILSLLHDTVLSLPINTLLGNYQSYLQLLVLSAQDKSMMQQKPLRRLLELVEEAKVKDLDDWALGCLVLSICRTMMLHHHTDILYSPMGDLLFVMMNTFGDSDIMDHARFYYALLTLNSDAKAKETIGAALFEGLRLGENIADFFPGSVIQTAPAEIVVLDLPPITWTRDSIDVEYELTHDKMDFDFPLPVTDGLEDYWEQLSYLRSTLKCNIKANLVKESDMDHVVAVSFLVSDENSLSFSQDVYLPHMNRSVAYAVSYKVIPKVPLPVSVGARAVFGYDKTTYECELSPIKFDPEDFLLPFPWQKFNIQDKQIFFKKHWENFSTKSTDKNQGVESVKILKCSRHFLMETWRNALVFSGPESGGDDEYGSDRYIFFLPPRFHILLMVRDRTTDTVVEITSDYWPALGYLDAYLEKLASAP